MSVLPLLCQFVALSLTASPGASDAPEASDETEDARGRIEARIAVVGEAEGAADLPGSAHVLSGESYEAQKQGFDDVHRMLRPVPGLNIQEEEGFGLRPNIGMRGTGSERSSKITLMEDGVLIAPAPYAAPAAYYFPTAGRMSGVEVRKGSSQIKFGPRTNGGVINLLSSQIPAELSLRSTLSAGSHGGRKLFANLGGNTGRIGWMLETYQHTSDGFKQLDGGGDTGFRLGDYLAKIRFETDSAKPYFQQIELKLGHTDQTADETYLGLTDDDFLANPRRRYAASQRDVFDSEHRQLRVRHFVALSHRFDLTTSVYRNDFRRNWYKLQSIGGQDLGAIFDAPEENGRLLDIARGADSAPDELKVRANNRDYYGAGVQSVFGAQLDIGQTRNALELGMRYHQDEEDRWQHEDGFTMSGGRMLTGTRGAAGSQANRVSTGTAWAWFMQNRLTWRRLSLTPGVRFESIDLERRDYPKADANRAEPARARRNSLSEVIPGLGYSYELDGRWTAFGGIHRGFSPPGPSASAFTQSERSINYELGTRFRQGAASADAVVFFSDYSNLLGSDTLSSGGSGEGDQFNGGAVHVGGLEVALSADASVLVPSIDASLPLRLTYTFTSAAFQNTFTSDYEPWGQVENGDELPYLPSHQLFVSVGYAGDDVNLTVDGSYTDRMRTVAGAGALDPRRATDSSFTVNLSGEYGLAETLRAFFAVQNVFDNEYIVARRPAGIRPGLPRTVTLGMKVTLH